jgi:hypothetical protein
MKDFVRLNKNEMKMVMGGVVDSGEGKCKTGPCQVVTINSDGSQTTNTGSCMIELEPLGTVGQGEQHGTCRCSAIGGDRITSNGGVSHCVI